MVFKCLIYSELCFKDVNGIFFFSNSFYLKNDNRGIERERYRYKSKNN